MAIEIIESDYTTLGVNEGIDIADDSYIENRQSGKANNICRNALNELRDKINEIIEELNKG